jgi:hypothetical protein
MRSSCPSDFASLIRKCWSHDRDARPHPSEIVSSLYAMLSAEIQRAVSMDYEPLCRKRFEPLLVRTEMPEYASLPQSRIATVNALKKKITCMLVVASHVWVGCLDGCIVILDSNGQVCVPTNTLI